MNYCLDSNFFSLRLPSRYISQDYARLPASPSSRSRLIIVSLPQLQPMTGVVSFEYRLENYCDARHLLCLSCLRAFESSTRIVSGTRLPLKTASAGTHALPDDECDGSCRSPLVDLMAHGPLVLPSCVCQKLACVWCLIANDV